MSSPTSRSLEKLRDDGWTPQVVEHWHHYAKKRMDLWGADIIAIREDYTLLVQTTVDANHAARRTKLLTIPEARLWVSSPFRLLVVHSWGLKGERGKRKTIQLREEYLTPEMFNQPITDYGQRQPSDKCGNPDDNLVTNPLRRTADLEEGAIR